MKAKAIFKLLLCIIIAVMLSCLFKYTESKVIDYYVIINIIITLFSVSLTIVALMITILDKYKEKVSNEQVWATNSTAILKELCENTIALLFLIILLALASMLETAINLIPKLDVMNIILLFSLIVSLLVTFDITICIYKLILHLKDALSPANNNEINLSQKELHLIEAYRFLDDGKKKSFEELIRAFTTNQQIDAKTTKK